MAPTSWLSRALPSPPAARAAIHPNDAARLVNSSIGNAVPACGNAGTGGTGRWA